MLVRQLVAGNTKRFVPVRFWVEEGLSGEDAAVVAGDELQRFRVAEGVLPGRGEQLADEVGGDVVHEGDGAEDGPGHCGAGLCGLRLQVVLDVVFADEVGDVGRYDLGFVAASVDGGEDEVLDA